MNKVDQLLEQGKKQVQEAKEQAARLRKTIAEFAAAVRAERRRR